MIIMDNVKQFSESAPDLMTAFSEYVECVKGNKQFGETSKSDMEKAINIAYMSEVENRCGVKKDTYMSEQRWANNSMVVECADAIRD